MDELIADCRSSAKAFRENSVFDSEGDEIRLIAQADIFDTAANTITRLRKALIGVRIDVADVHRITKSSFNHDSIGLRDALAKIDAALTTKTDTTKIEKDVQ